MLEDRYQGEADALADLARSLTSSRADMAATAREVETLVAEAIKADTPRGVELGFEHAARRLRAGWLKSVAAETSRVLRSPTEHEIARLQRGRHDAYGYERDFQPESLEARCEAFFGPAPPGWRSAHVVFSSGQAATATVLLHLAERMPGKLRVAHLGAYFETHELVDRACLRVQAPAEADCVIVDPIASDGRLTARDPAAIARDLAAGQALVVDETLSAPATQLPAILGAAAASDITVLRLVSGLKLLQQGLELANVGIVSVFARDAGRAAVLAEGLKRCRTLTGTGLRFVDALALEAPFFLDRAATCAYADKVFAHNAALAQAISLGNRLFKPFGDTGAAGAGAPFCALELETGNTVPALEALAERIEREATARGLLLERGGSFGFRGHRFEVIEPETGAPPFLRIAMGARDDHSCRGVIALMAEIAEGSAEAA